MQAQFVVMLKAIGFLAVGFLLFATWRYMRSLRDLNGANIEPTFSRLAQMLAFPPKLFGTPQDEASRIIRAASVRWLVVVIALAIGVTQYFRWLHGMPK